VVFIFNQNGRGFKLPKVLSRQDAAKLLNTPDTSTFCGLRDKVAMLFMYRAALRVSEVCNLTVDDVDLEKGFIFVRSGKGDKDRVVPMDPELLEWCNKWLTKGTPVLPRFFKKVVPRYAKQSGIYIRNGKEKKTPSCHTLRHCCLIEMIEDGVALQKVQEIAGHRSIATTVQYLCARKI